jgi:hypothetical protein
MSIKHLYPVISFKKTPHCVAITFLRWCRWHSSRFPAVPWSPLRPGKIQAGGDCRRPSFGVASAGKSSINRRHVGSRAASHVRPPRGLTAFRARGHRRKGGEDKRWLLWKQRARKAPCHRIGGRHDLIDEAPSQRLVCIHLAAADIIRRPGALTLPLDAPKRMILRRSILYSLQI